MLTAVDEADDLQPALTLARGQIAPDAPVIGNRRCACGVVRALAGNLQDGDRNEGDDRQRETALFEQQPGSRANGHNDCDVVLDTTARQLSSVGKEPATRINPQALAPVRVDDAIPRRAEKRRDRSKPKGADHRQPARIVTTEQARKHATPKLDDRRATTASRRKQ